MSTRPILIRGEWKSSSGTSTFQSYNPSSSQPLADEYPLSPWEDIEAAITSAADAARAMRGWPGTRYAQFLECYAERIDTRADELVEMANLETALPVQPRLKDVELPRTTNQLRQAATAARDGSWSHATIDSNTNIRSIHGPIGPVIVFGPNNFPFAFSGIAGGDFAAAAAAGNPVIAKGHSLHPATTRIFAEEAQLAASETEMPPGFVQLIYRCSHANGCKMVSHPLVGATGYTGARQTGLVLKEAADKAGKPIYLELSSVNPVFILPAALEERLEEIAEDFCTSCLMGTGQFCTNPGLVVVQTGGRSHDFVESVKSRFEKAPVGTMLGEGVQRHFAQSIETLAGAGAQVAVGGEPADGSRFAYRNTVLSVDGDTFLQRPQLLQTEAFGNGTLLVSVKDADQMIQIAEILEGNLTGCIYSESAGKDDELYDRLSPAIRCKVGRLLNDKMPTGVAVSAAMNHGGPFPATGHPAFTAVGIPASIHRFSQLQCYDNVRPHRLPPPLQDKNPTGSMWRSIDGTWTQNDVPLETA